MRKGFTEATEQMIQWIGLVVISIIMLYVIITWASAGSQVQRGIEQGSLMYTIASSTNALSTMEEGEIVRNLRSHFDIEVSCSGECVVTTAVYDQDGKRQKESNEILILGEIEPISMKMVNKITLTKERGGKVILTGEQTEDLFGTELQIKQYSPMCMDTNARFRDLIQAASKKYNIEEELIAATIIAESNWDPNSKRYEPGYQIRYVEGSSWVSSDYWIKEGDSGAVTIRKWFSQNPSREAEMDKLSGSQLDLIAQTRISSSYGLMQTMFLTAYETCGYRGSPDGLKDAAVNIDCGTKILKTKLDLYGGLSNAVSAYNAGSPAWQSNLANRYYTEKVLGLYNAFNACPT